MGLFLYFGTTVFVMSGTKATFSFVPVGKVTPPGGGATTTTGTPKTSSPAADAGGR